MKLKWNETRFDSALGRARGLGAAGSSALHHWVHQRVTAIANVVLSFWLVLFVLTLVHTAPDYAGARALLASGLHPVFALLFVVSAFYHAKLGLQVVVEDYVPHEGIKIASLLAIKFLVVFMATVCVVSILKVVV